MQQSKSSDSIFKYHFPTFYHILNPYHTIKDEFYLDVFKNHVAPNTTVLLYRDAVNLFLPDDLQMTGSSDYVVARIIEIQDDGNIVVNLYEYFLDHELHKTYGIIPMTSNEGACHHVVEVIQTLRRAVVADTAIYDVAFIFSVTEIIGGISCQLISNCFVVRFRYDYLCNIQHIIDVRECFVPALVSKDHRFLPSLICKNYLPTMSCFIGNLWSNITTLQTCFFSALNRAEEKQGNYATFLSKVNIDVSFWRYIYNKVCHCVKPYVIEVNKKRSVILSNLTRQSFQIKGQELILRFETQHQLQVLTSVIGVCCYAGVRRKRPKIRQENLLTVYDTVNAIPGAMVETEKEEKVNMQTVRPGVDLIFYCDEYKCTEIFIKVRYVNMPNDKDFHYKEIWPNQYNSAVDQDMENLCYIKVGNMVQIDETVFQIISVTPMAATLKAMNVTNEIRIFSRHEFEHLESLLEDYNF